MERIIFHADLNHFYAAVECRRNPKLRNVPMAVGGDESKRRGVVLAKNELARACGVKTGESIWEAKRKCPELVVVPTHFDEYEKASRDARQVYGGYTDRVEPFGADECWLDMTGCVDSFDKAKLVADRLRQEMRDTLGLTVSVGVSFNKVFAKLASDYKKPDATTVITHKNYREIVWPMPVSALLYVGKATEKKLSHYGIHTIGDLARSEREFLKRLLGKKGESLWVYASGLDISPVHTERDQAKSIGNSTTIPRDITQPEEARLVLYALCEKVSSRLREQGLCCCGVQLSVKNSDFEVCEHQAPLDAPADTSQEMFDAVWEIYCSKYSKSMSVRSLGVRAIRLEKGIQEQISLFDEDIRRTKHKNIERAKDKLIKKYGAGAVTRGVFFTDPELLPGRGHKINTDSQDDEK